MTRKQHNQRGFSLLELLVVITIIALLMGLVVAAGSGILGNQKVKQAKDLLSTLDRALTDYMVENNDQPPPYVASGYVNTPGTGYHATQGGMNDMGNPDGWPNLDGTDYPRHPDAAVFIRQAQGIGAIDEIMSGIGERWLVSTPEADASASDDPTSPSYLAADATPSVLDPWSDPAVWRAPWPIVGVDGVATIYYVHPRNELAQRLYGRCVGGRPYFFSAGPDGIYGSTTHLSADGTRDAAFIQAAVDGLADNVYSYTPGAPDMTAAFNSAVR